MAPPSGLMEIAVTGSARPGSVTVGEPTYRATREAIEYRALEEPLELKGKAEPVQAFAVGRAESSRTRQVSVQRLPLTGRNAELGAVSPTEFIPVAEETGLILAIGTWVLRPSL